MCGGERAGDWSKEAETSYPSRLQACGWGMGTPGGPRR